MESSNTFLKFVAQYSDEEILKQIDDPSDIDTNVYHALLITAKERELITEEEFYDFVKTSDIPEIAENSDNPAFGESEKKQYWKCPECHQLVDMEYELCWSCQHEKPVNIEYPSDRELIDEKAETDSGSPVKTGLIVMGTGVLAFSLEYFILPDHVHLYRLVMAVLLMIVGLIIVIVGISQNLGNEQTKQ
jgi:hypothetical protein